MPAAPISIQQNRPARPAGATKKTAALPCSAGILPALLTRSKPPSLQRRRSPPSFQWHRHSCLCSDDLPPKFRSRVHPSLQSFESSGFLQPLSPQKKTPPSCIWRRVQIPRLVCLLPSQPAPARAHKSTTRTITASAVDPLAAFPHAQKPTPDG